MLGKIWKKILVVILIIACLFNIVRILVNKVPLLQELQATLNNFLANNKTEENIINNNSIENIINQSTGQSNLQTNQNITQQTVLPQSEQQYIQQQNSQNQQQYIQQQNSQNQQQVQNGGQVQPQSEINSQQSSQSIQQQNNQAYLDRMYQKSMQQNQNFLAQVQGQNQN